MISRERIVILKWAISVMAWASLTTIGQAAEYPERTMRWIVVFAPGGASDAAARVVGRHVSKVSGQSVVIDNRPGGQGAVAAGIVMNASDPHTLLWAPAGLVPLPLIVERPPYASMLELTPVALAGHLAYGMFVSGGSPAKSVTEFARYAQAQGGQTFGVASLSEHLAAAQFMKAASVTMTKVSYKGGAVAMPDLAAGRLSVFFTPVGSALGLTRDGRLRALGILRPQRVASLPDVPTMIEAGYPGVAVPTWQAVFAPPKTHTRVVTRLSDWVNAAVSDKGVISELERFEVLAEGAGASGLAALVAKDGVSWQAFVRDNGINKE